MIDDIGQLNFDGQVVFGLFGAGGFGREVMPLVVESIAKKNHLASNFKIYFIETSPSKTEINGHPLISESEFFELKCDQRYFNIAIGNSKERESIAEAFLKKGAKPISIRSPHSIAYDENQIAGGAVLCAYSMITSNARIGKFFHSNIYSYVAHDCVIGDYVTLAPNVHCNGNVHIHNHAYIGTGAVIKQGSPTTPIVIGEGAIIGMGAVVTKSVSPFTTVVGNPARPI
jgi:sugar O-acyltransferase (sialic acid O-acetyltransferase NeuD family)